MGDFKVRPIKNASDRAKMYKYVLEDIRAFDKMLENGLIESGAPKIGAEQELCLVDWQGEPSTKALEILDSILILHPEDLVSKKRAKEIKESMNSVVNPSVDSELKVLELRELTDKEEIVESSNSESTGHDELQKLVENKKKKDKDLLLIVKNKLEDFACSIKIEATKKQLSL